MYSICSRTKAAKPTYPLKVCGILSLQRAYSVPSPKENLQILQNALARASKNKNKSVGAAPLAAGSGSKARDSRPLYGGYARNNLTPSYRSSALPVFKMLTSAEEFVVPQPSSETKNNAVGNADNKPNNHERNSKPAVDSQQDQRQQQATSSEPIVNLPESSNKPKVDNQQEQQEQSAYSSELVANSRESTSKPAVDSQPQQLASSSGLVVNLPESTSKPAVDSQKEQRQQKTASSGVARFLFLRKRTDTGAAKPLDSKMAEYKEKLRLESESFMKKQEIKVQKETKQSKMDSNIKSPEALLELERVKMRLAKQRAIKEASKTTDSVEIDVGEGKQTVSEEMRKRAELVRKQMGPKHDEFRTMKPTDQGEKSRKDRERQSTAQRDKRSDRVSDRSKGLEDDSNKKKIKFKLPKKGQEVTLPLTISVDGLAKLLNVPNFHLLRKMRRIGMDKLANNYILSNEEAADIALEYDVVPIIPEDKGPELYPQKLPEDMSAHPLRPPVVTIMGHVDHGKTTLLDTLRSSSITATEAGGITQHIGAFSVDLKSGQNITFLDTPGHAAFSAMRARGANATDIVVLVVAADDGVMPQTKEAIQHALEADVPIIVAINKCDKPGADPSAIHNELLKHGIQTEELGGDIQAVKISALKGTGMDELAETIVTLAEVLDLRAEVDIPAHATVIESQVEKGRGSVASVLVKRGTLRAGDVVVAGTTWCKVRGMTDDRGKAVKSAGPACAVRVMGWKEIPRAGDLVLQAGSEQNAKDVVANRIEKRTNRERLATISELNDDRRSENERSESTREAEIAFRRAAASFKKGLRTTYPTKAEFMQKVSRTEAASEAANEGAKPEPLVVPIVIKGDVSGTVEAVSESLEKLPSSKIRINIIGTGVGPVTESDVAMAGAGSQGVVIAFNVKADKKTLSVAKREGVEVKTFRIIYNLLEDVEKLLVSRLPPILVEEIRGEAVVQQTFDITLRAGLTTTVAGCRVTTGAVARANKMRVLRSGTEVHTGPASSLKNEKHDIAEATKGQEFGVSFDDFEGVKEGDVIQSLHYNEVPQKLN